MPLPFFYILDLGPLLTMAHVIVATLSRFLDFFLSVLFCLKTWKEEEGSISGNPTSSVMGMRNQVRKWCWLGFLKSWDMWEGCSLLSVKSVGLKWSRMGERIVLPIVSFIPNYIRTRRKRIDSPCSLVLLLAVPILVCTWFCSTYTSMHVCVCIVSICVYVWVWVCAHVWGVCVYGFRLDTISQIIIASLKQEWTCKNLNEPLKKCFSGWRDDSVIKDAFNHWTWQPEFNPSSIHMVKRESQLLESCLWTSMHVPRHVYPRHLWISKSNKIFKKNVSWNIQSEK